MTVQQYLTYFDEILKPTEPLFRLIPPEKLDWKPTENSFTIGQLIAHIVGALLVYGNGITTGEWGFQSMREIFVMNRRQTSVTIEEAIGRLHANTSEFKRLVGSLSDDEFSFGVVDSPQLGRVPRLRLAMLGIEHHLNHKTELFMYLKLLGVDVNTGTLYRG